MLDFLGRACRRPFDYIGICRRHKLNFLNSKHEGEITYSFEFATKDKLHWKAGQHGVFVLPLDKTSKDRGWRPFSICSSPKEGVVRIATNIPPDHSDFKERLQNLKPGEEMILFGPLGEFYIGKKTKKIVGIAGGIGITPFRALAYEINQNLHKDVSLELIYGGKNGFFAFKEEFDTFNEHPDMDIIYANSSDEVNLELDKLTEKYSNSARYFISGSPGMISALVQKLKDKNIKQITTDPFKGY